MNNNFIKLKHFKRYLTSQPFFIWHTLNTNILKDENIIENFWDSEFIELMPKSFGAIIAQTFHKFDEWLIQKLMKNNDYKIINGSIEEKIIQTKKYLTSQKMLIKPIFEYNGAIATPFAFNCKTKEIINIKYSKKTKRCDFITSYYDYSIILKNIDVNNYLLFLPKDKEYLKGEIDLYPIDRCHKQVSGFVPGVVNAKGNRKDVLFLEVVKNRWITKNNYFPTIETTIKSIKQAKNVINISSDFISDATIFGTNIEWDKLLETQNSQYLGISGKIFQKKEIAKLEFKRSKVWNEYQNINKTKIIDKNFVQSLFNQITNANRVIWYDFEGFSLPFAPLDHVSPHQQLVFQVSIIETIQNVEINNKNIVIDPLNMNKDDIFHIIQTVFSKQADAYVVYNKAYENTRIKEMVELLEKSNYPQVAIAKKMFKHISDHTFDLYDLFVISGKNKLPPILMSDQKCRASIKNIEKHIHQNHIKLPRPIQSYTNLDIQNGGMAMNTAIERAVGIIGNNEWKQTINKLKIYCENDVRAMIMVYDFIKYLLS